SQRRFPLSQKKTAMTLTTLAILAGAFFISTCLGWFVSTILLPSHLSRRFAWAVAPGVGIGISSILFFVFRRALFGSEFVAFIILAALAWRRRNFSIARPKLLAPAMLVVLFSGSLGIAMAGMMIRIDRIPHGDWDGWAIWNAHARFLFRDGQNWQRDI